MKIFIFSRKICDSDASNKKRKNIRQQHQTKHGANATWNNDEHVIFS